MLAFFAAALIVLPSPLKQDIDPDQYVPWATLTYSGWTSGALGQGRTTTTVEFRRYVTLGQDWRQLSNPAPRWIVRKEVKSPEASSDRRNGDAFVEWIDERECPAVHAVMVDLETLPRIIPYRLREIDKPFPLAPPPHGAGVMLNFFGLAGTNEVRVQLVDTSGSTVWPWWERSAQLVEGCWVSTQPSYP